ncbi:unnamed protein product [Tilletia controversa]|uniref:Cutinase n=3 Tax=Tilletia TaxID=13289 RepID=A0A8X7SZ09_9BASI|nr:hypothetical protein CF335_g5936 [Tilletia laevis]KAE8201987.1 hypothetical protein CF328_g2478 [Tilletia controversa]KAE8253595.1 hypothetical protein A4X03_0g5856 [Tilletia caries]KAE8196923.1 hypothetical protein CF336_g2403 [Tilletia laevis]KAE8251775.1 hypothetical protein A4X06_0g2534 [Tilletia controversa]
MKLVSMLLLAVSSTALLSGMSYAQDVKDSATDCKAYVLISARGIREPQGPSIAFTGMIQQTLAALPGGVEVDTVYPADPSVSGTSVGVAFVSQFIMNGLKQCKDQKYALLGYSQGALLESVAAALLLHSPEAYAAIKAIVFAGNPLHVPNRQGNVDESGGSSNADVPGESVEDNPDLFNKYAEAGKVLDICFAGDPICDAHGQGGLATHQKYGTTPSVQDIGAKFLISALRN